MLRFYDCFKDYFYNYRENKIKNMLNQNLYNEKNKWEKRSETKRGELLLIYSGKLRVYVEKRDKY